MNGHWAQAEETVDHSNGHLEGTEHGGHSITVVEVSSEYGSKGSKGGDYGYGYGYGGDYGGKSGKGSSYGYYEIVCKETEEKPHPAPEPEPAPEPPAPMPIPVSLLCPDSIQQRMNIIFSHFYLVHLQLARAHCITRVCCPYSVRGSQVLRADDRVFGRCGEYQVY